MTTLTTSQKDFIRKNCARMYVRTMSSILLVEGSAISSYIDQEGLPRFLPKGGRKSGRATLKKVPPPPDNYFNVSSRKNWLVNEY